jgi:hypothetical protein
MKVRRLMIQSGRSDGRTDRLTHTTRSPRRVFHPPVPFASSHPRGFVLAVVHPGRQSAISQGRLHRASSSRRKPMLYWKRMLQTYVQVFEMFQMYAASVSYACCKSRYVCCIYYKGYKCMLQVSIQNVSSSSNVYCKCFIWMLHMFAVGIHICCKGVFQMFHLF